MVDHRSNKDYLLAQKICKALRARHNESILELYHVHHRFFLAFARRRLYNPEHDQIESVLSQFWTELLNAKAICGYEGKASLRTYLLTILNRRIIDANRKFQREMRFTELTEGSVDYPSDNETIYSISPLNENEPPVLAKKLKKARRVSQSPLERFDFSQLKLVGIIVSSDGNIAVIEDSSGKGYIVEKGAYIGLYPAKIKAIKKDRILIEEETKDTSGKTTFKKHW